MINNLLQLAILWVLKNYSLVLFLLLGMHLLSGLYDQIIHSTENVDINELFKHLHPKVNLLMILGTK